MASAHPLYGDLAHFYDAITRPKDYASEVQFLVRVFRQFAKGKVKRVMDVGCGTGTHAKLLASKGYEVTGVDISRSMLAIAREKAPRVKFVRQDMRHLRLSRKFDAITCMYGSISYCEDNDELKRVLQRFYLHLEVGGVLVFDVFLKRLLRNGFCWIDHGRMGGAEVTSVSTTFLQKRRALFRWIFFVRKGSRTDVVFDEHRLGLFEEGRIRTLLGEIGFSAKVFRGFPDGYKPRTVTFVAVRRE